MAKGVNAMDTMNNATIFPVVTKAAVGSFDLSCFSDVCCAHRDDKYIDTKEGICGSVDQVSYRTCFHPWLSCHKC